MAQFKINLLDGINIIVDRDGTIIKDKHYLADPAGIEFIPGVISALRQLTQLGAKLFVATNQSGLGRGYFSLANYYACAARLNEILSDEGIEIVHTSFCPHAPEDQCDCRKPAPGMWRELSAQYGLKASRTIMIGDKMDDVSFGLNCNFAASILVLTGKGSLEAEKYKLALPPALMDCARTDVCSTDHQIITLPRDNPAHPHAVAVNLSAAAGWVIQNYRHDK